MANKPKVSNNNSQDVQNEKKDNILWVIISIIVLVILVIIIFRLTFAYFSAYIKPSSDNDTNAVVKGASLKVEYEDGTSNLDMGAKIGPGDTITKTFKVKNTGTAAGHFSIVLTNIVNNFERQQDLNYTLTRGDTPAGIGTISVASSQQFPGTSSEKVVIAEDESVQTENTYTLTITYANPNEDQSEDMGKPLEAKINIIEVESEKRNSESESKTSTTTTTTTTQAGN